MISLLQNLINKGSSALKSNLTTISKNAAKPDTKKTVLFKGTLPPELAKSTSIMDNSGSAKVVPNPFISPNFVSGATLSTEAPEKTWEGTSIQDRLAQAGSAAKTGNVAKAITLFGSSLNPELKKLTEIGAQQKAQQELESSVASKYSTTQTPNWPTPSLNPLDVVKKQAPILDVKKSSFYQLPKAQQEQRIKEETIKQSESAKSKDLLDKYILGAEMQVAASPLKKFSTPTDRYNQAFDEAWKQVPEKVHSMFKPVEDTLDTYINNTVSVNPQVAGALYLSKQFLVALKESALGVHSGLTIGSEGMEDIKSGQISQGIGKVGGGVAGVVFAPAMTKFNTILNAIPYGKEISNAVIGGATSTAVGAWEETADKVGNITGNKQIAQDLKNLGSPLLENLVPMAIFHTAGKAWAKANPSIVKAKLNSALKSAERQKGGQLTDTEAREVISNVQIFKGFYARDLLVPERMIGLKGGKEGTPGIDYSSPLPKVSTLGETLKEVSGQTKIKPTVEIKPRTDLGDVKLGKFPKRLAEAPETPAETRRIATENPNMYYREITNKDTIARANESIKSDEMSSYSRAISGKGLDDQAIALQLLSKYQEAGKWDRVNSLMEAIRNRGTEAGQLAQIHAAYSKLTPEGALMEANNLLKKLKEKGIKLSKEQADYQLTAEQRTNIIDRAKTIQSLPDGSQARAYAVGELMRDIGNIAPKSLSSKISGFQTMAQLLNPKTMIRNLSGNAVFKGQEELSNILASAIDRAYSKTKSIVTGKYVPRTVTTGYAEKYIPAALKGLKEGTKQAIKGISVGEEAGKWDIEGEQGHIFKGKVLGTAEKALNIGLKATDKAFAGGSYEVALWREAKLKGMNKGLKGKELAAFTKKTMEDYGANLSKTEINKAKNTAAYDTFQDDSILSRAFVASKKALNTIGFGGQLGVYGRSGGFGLGDVILKYAKTPANIIMRGVEYSKLGYVKAIIEGGKSVLAKTPEKKLFYRGEAIKSISRATVGTATSLAATKLAELGIVSGAQSKDKDEAALKKLEGEGQFTVNTSALGRWIISGFKDDAAKIQKGDSFSSYDSLLPIGQQIATGAKDWEDNKNRASKGEIDFSDPNSYLGILGSAFKIATDQVESGASSSLGVVESQPLVTGLKRLFGYGDLTGGLVETAKSIPASFVPTVVNQIRQVVDNTARETYSDNDLQMALNLVMNKIPGLHTYLKKKVDVYGRDQAIYQEMDDGVWGAIKHAGDVFLNPTFVTHKIDDPVTAELFQLATETGETDFFPVVSPKKVKIGETNYDMTSDEYEKWSRNTGNFVRANYEAEMDDPNWDSKTPEDKRLVLKDILDEGRKNARLDFLESRLNKLLETKGQEAADEMLNKLSDADYEALMNRQQ